jgi:hypothetical protein
MKTNNTIKTLVISTILAAVATTNVAYAKGKGKTKHWVCHSTSLISDGTLTTGISGSFIPAGETVGQLILVAEPSLPAHCAHGDRVFDFEGAPFTPVRGLCRPDAGPGGYDVDC